MDIYEEVVSELFSWDIPITIENILSTVSKWIKNIQSHVGPEARTREAAYVVDETGITGEERDNANLAKIERYKDFLSKLNTVSKMFSGYSIQFGGDEIYFPSLKEAIEFMYKEPANE